MHEEETVCHFTAVCPILSEFRNAHFGQARLTLEEFINLLNGKISWSKLAAFCKVAYKYRYFLFMNIINNVYK
jgi:hypothetical protein